jgi:succinyl-diaminopimelate desuccinylase
MGLTFEKDAVIHETLSKLIQFPSVFDGTDAVYPYGKDNVDALTYLLELAETEGFKTANLDNQVGYIEYGEGEDYIAVLAHLDVVPAGNYWSYDPFGGVIEEDRIVGRGALDDKGPVVASFYALKAIKDAGLKFDKRIRLILGLNEETGSKCVKHYLTCEKPPLLGFTPDAEFPVIYAEKGITTFGLSSSFDRSSVDSKMDIIDVSGGTVVNMVPDLCEATIALHDEVDLLPYVERFNHTYDVALKLQREGHSVSLSLKGVSAHASQPELGRNAVSYMMVFLNSLPLADSDLKNAIASYCELIALEFYGNSIGMGLVDEPSGKLTLNVGQLSLDQDGMQLKANVRYPVTFGAEDVYNPEFKRKIEAARWQLEEGRIVAPIVHDKEGALVKTLMGVYQKHTGDLEAQPMSIGGGTYARSMPNIVAFGPLFPHTHDTMHQADEYITKADLELMVKMYADAMIQLAQ